MLDIDIVHARTMFQFLEVRYLTLLAIETEAPENLDGLRVLTDDFCNGHTHSVQQPGGKGGSSGGQREFAPVMARAAAAIGVAAVFIETHEDPDRSPSDGPNMIYLDQMPKLVETLMAFDKLAKDNPLAI